MRSSLQEWIDLYEKTGSPVRKARKNRVAYKVKKEHIEFLREELKKKPDIFISDLKELLEKKYPDVEIDSPDFTNPFPRHASRLKIFNILV